MIPAQAPLYRISYIFLYTLSDSFVYNIQVRLVEEDQGSSSQPHIDLISNTAVCRETKSASGLFLKSGGLVSVQKKLLCGRGSFFCPTHFFSFFLSHSLSLLLTN